MGNLIVNSSVGQAVQIDGDFSGGIDMSGDGIRLLGIATAPGASPVGMPAELLDEVAAHLGQVAAAGLGPLSDTAAHLVEEVAKVRR